MICIDDLASLAVCRECQHPFWIDYCAKSRPREFCSARCGRRSAKREYDKSENGRASRSRQAHVRRMRESGAEVERFTPMEIFARDKWRCGVCGKRVPKVKHPDPLSASLDHVIPLSEGGPHTRANVRLAHLICNSVRRDGATNDQLRMLG
jgi:5-methylcytosine-specific restriction endonuclease McrA